jgi:hypothetical protein
LKVSKWELIGLRIWHISILVGLICIPMIFIPDLFIIVSCGLTLAVILFFVGYSFMIYGCFYGNDED